METKIQYAKMICDVKSHYIHQFAQVPRNNLQCKKKI